MEENEQETNAEEAPETPESSDESAPRAVFS